MDEAKFANDFEERHGWSPDIGYEVIEPKPKKKKKEPLIEDEKIHKIVRDWAECCGFSLLKHYLSEGLSCFICTDEEGNDYCLDFTSRIDNLESGKIYNIKEL